MKMIDIAKVREALNSIGEWYVLKGWDRQLLKYVEIENFEVINKALTELERLQKKEVAMKPKIFTQEKGYKIEICPSCEGSIHALKHWHEINGRGTHCDLCGQKLDWSDEK
jgi:hypothetical protein